MVDGPDLPAGYFLQDDPPGILPRGYYYLDSMALSEWTALSSISFLTREGQLTYTEMCAGTIEFVMGMIEYTHARLEREREQAEARLQAAREGGRNR